MTTISTSHKAKSTGARIAAVLFWLFVWQIASLVIANDVLLCGPIETIQALVLNAVRPEFWWAVGSTFASVLIGFSFALVSGLVLGVLSARFVWVETLFAPLVSLLKSVPVVCIIVLLLIWLGSSRAVAAVVFLVAFIPVYVAVLEGMKAVNEPLHRVMEIQNVSTVRRACALWWPAILPFLQASARSFVGMSWKSGVAAELIGIPLGTLGAQIYQAKILLSTADLFACTLVIIVLSAVCERAFLWLLSHSGKAAYALAFVGGVSAGSQCLVSQDNFDVRDCGRYEGSMKASIHASVPQNDSLVEVKNATKTFGNQITPFSGVSFTLFAGETLLLNQPSGAGKSTLLHSLEGIEPLTEGDISYGKNHALSVVLQQSALVEELSAIDNIALFVNQRVTKEEIQTLLTEMLDPEVFDRPTSTLSGGQRRRVELARALLSESTVLILDEPFAGLDQAAIQTCLKTIDSYRDNRALIIASHDVVVAEYWHAQQVSFS